MPLCLREDLQDSFNLRAQRRRAHRSGEEAQTRALVGFVIQHAASHGSQELTPGTRLSFVCERNRTVRIVEAKNRGLRKKIGGSKAATMLRIPFDLGGTE